jgi:capsular polysaccharide transport system permease protein
MARRVAQKHGIAATSDFDAVRQLRAAGIDPFQRSTLLELVVPPRDDDIDEAAPPPGKGKVQLPMRAETAKLPQTQPMADAGLPSTEVNPADRRAKEIMRIQRDIARRRRRKLALLATRLAFFVFLPTFIVGFYFFKVATPMYGTKSEFLILQADAQGGSGLGGLLSGTQFATNQDSIAVQSYLQSRDAMLLLDRDMGFKSHFSQPYIDAIQRLPEAASDEKAYTLFKKNIKIGYDPTEGVIKMEVVAADPQTSERFSEHLIEYAEQRVDDLSKRKREDQMRDARASLERAKEERREAQERLVTLQEGSMLDPQGEIANIRALIGSVELQLQEKELALNSQLNNARPNRARVDALQSEVRLLREELARQNRRMNEATEGSTSLASQTAQIQMAQADLVTADLFLQSALTNEKQTELEANRQVRYLTTSVRPVAPDDPTYPRAFEDTILAFLIFSGVYLMLSITASILREQASS